MAVARLDRAMRAATPPRRGLGSLWLPVAVSAACYTGFVARTAFEVDGETYFSLFDDAMISMTYARNLAEGAGLVWLPSGPAVEGYTNFAWTAWMALLHLVPVAASKVSLLVMVSGVALLLAAVGVVFFIARRVFPDLPAAAPVAAWLTGLYYPLAYWTLRGMEVGLLALLVSVAVLLALRLREGFSWRDLVGLAGVAALAVLTRTDALLPIGVVAAFAWWTARPDRRLPVAAVLAGTVAVTLAAHTGFRLAVYGAALPNTAALKLGGIALSTRIERGVAALGYVGLVHLWAALAAAVAGLAVRRRTLDRPAVALLAAVFAGQCAYSVVVGGDAWEWMRYANRYVATGAPALLVLAAGGVAALAGAPLARLRRTALALAGVAIVVVAGTALDGLVPATLLQLSEPAATGVMIALPVVAALCLLALPALARAGGRTVALLLLGAVVLVAVNGAPVAQWLATGGAHVADDARMTRYALLLRETTDPDAEIAVVWAGALPYWSRRASLDLLGKTDPVVAAGPARDRPFHPGHMKTDYAYSVGTRRPDLVAQVFSPSRADLRAIRSYGYTPVAERTFVRKGTTAVDVAALRAALAGSPHRPSRAP